MTGLRRVFVAFLLVSGAAVAPPAMAATLVDTGTPTGDGVPTNGWTLANNQTLAGLFTLGGATTITSVEGFIRNVSGVAATGSISIFTGGVDPAFSGLRHSANFVIAESPLGDWQGVFGRSWNLAAGQYWVVFGSDGNNSMTYSPPNPLSQNANASQLGGPWVQRGSAFGIGVRITDDVGTAVPEPATWAMMLLGFGAIGGAVRSRRQVAVSFG